MSQATLERKNNVTTKKQPTNLIESWLLAEQYERGLDEPKALAILNAMTGKRYTMWRVKEWQTGKRAIPTGVRQHMMERAMWYVLEDYFSPKGAFLKQPELVAEEIVNRLV
jgi:hypothetical protein